MRSDGEELRSSVVETAENESGSDLTLVSGNEHGELAQRYEGRGADLKSICLSIVIAVTTIGFLPVERAWRAMLEEMRAVENSVSAAVPAPQHMMLSAM